MGKGNAPENVMAKSAVCHSGQLRGEQANADRQVHAVLRRRGQPGHTSQDILGRDGLPAPGNAETSAPGEKGGSINGVKEARGSEA